MRILIVAYEFPPSPSPGALRWRYLARELAENGHDIVVIAPRLPLAGTEFTTPNNIRVLRTFAGPVVGLLEWSARGKTRMPKGPTPAALTPTVSADTNWKYALVQTIKSLQGAILFPDSRAEWRPWAARALGIEITRSRPDLIISAHEPATTLQLGLAATKHAIPWVVDLGDPVLAPYTPRRWRRRAARLERHVCKAASHVVVTTESARSLMMERHALDPDSISVLTQGFEDRGDAESRHLSDVEFGLASLELLYCGRFYPFRKPDQLLAAVDRLEGVRLTIMSPELPAGCAKPALLESGKVRYLGQLRHDEALALQRRADVLVSIGNDGMGAQIPGKLYEYLGARRPILHLLGDGGEDPAAALVDSTGAGWSCVNDVRAVRDMLEKMLAAKHNGTLGQDRTGTAAAIEAFGWSRIGRRYSTLVERLAGNAQSKQEAT